jgi:hypothetical protein
MRQEAAAYLTYSPPKNVQAPSTVPASVRRRKIDCEQVGARNIGDFVGSGPKVDQLTIAAGGPKVDQLAIAATAGSSPCRTAR